MKQRSSETVFRQGTSKAATGFLRRKCACGQHAGGGECEECRKKKSLRRRSDQSAEPSGVPPIVHEVLRSSAQPLDTGTREFMEPRFGHDFSGVRVHTDSHAAASARSVGALAYTVGDNVVFGSGQYAPETPGGRELLAHELAHVVQQSGSSTGGALTIDNDAGAERQADSMARSAVSGAHVAPPGTTGQRLQRRPLPADERDLDAPHGPGRGRGRGAAHWFLECVKEKGEQNRQRCAEQHLGVPAEPRFGEAETTSPVASNKIKPQNIMLGELGQEVTLFAAAQAVIKWAEKKQAALPSVPGTAAKAFVFSAADLFSDKATIKKLKPVPESEAELTPVLDLLVSHGVLIPDGSGGFSLVMDEATGKPAAEGLTRSQSEVAQFTKDFQKRVAKEDPLAPVVSTGQIPMSWSSDSSQVKIEEEATKALADLKAQLGELIVILPARGKKAGTVTRALTDTPTPVTDKAGKTVAWEIPVADRKKPVRFPDPFEKIERVADGSHPETVKQRERITAEIKKAEAALRVKGRYRTFAEEVIGLFNRLRSRNTTWRAGTYVGHSWGEFSADIFFNVAFDKAAPGFWRRDVVRTFFDDLNAAAEEDDKVVGKFAWRAIYNDDPLRAEINKKYGANRVINVPHHGPHPDKLHIHLDLTPVNLQKDEVTGYKVENGRIRILKSGP